MAQIASTESAHFDLASGHRHRPRVYVHGGLSGQFPVLAGARFGVRVGAHADLASLSPDWPATVIRRYGDYVDAVDALIASEAIPDPCFLWWEVRLQPALGTVEVWGMDVQSTIGEVAPLVAVIQSLARLELEGEPSPVVPGAEVLAENRFLAARDGMDARLIDPTTRSLVPVREMLDGLLAACRPHALALGCADALDQVLRLADANGAARQRVFVARDGPLDELVARLADRFLAPGWLAATEEGNA